MRITIKSCAITILICCLLGGATKYDFRNATVAKTQPTTLIKRAHKLKRQNRLTKVAINKLGESDSGNAKVEYDKPDKTLKFVLLDMDALPEFKSHLVNKQTKRFKHITHLKSITPILIVSHRARIRKIIQLHEEAQQRQLDAKRANKAKAIQAHKNRQNELNKLTKLAENKKQSHKRHQSQAKPNHKRNQKNRKHRRK